MDCRNMQPRTKGSDLKAAVAYSVSVSLVRSLVFPWKPGKRNCTNFIFLS